MYILYNTKYSLFCDVRNYSLLICASHCPAKERRVENMYVVEVVVSSEPQS